VRVENFFKPLFALGLLAIWHGWGDSVPEGLAAVSHLRPETPSRAEPYPWWIWALVLFGFSFVVGILSLLGGMGGGTLFVSVVGSFLFFHLDFVRGASLLVALTGALSAGPGLLRYGMGNLRLSLPAGLMTSTGAIIGALLGLRVPTAVVQVALGLTILGVVILLLKAKRTDYPEVQKADELSRVLGIAGVYLDRALGREVPWQIHRTSLGLVMFGVIGFMAGLFGIGAGWANVLVLNLVMGVPLKVAVGTSKLIVCLTNTAAAWVYLHSGALLLILAVPSVLGMMLGSWAGVGILLRLAPIRLKVVVIALLLFAGARSLLKGLGVWS